MGAFAPKSPVDTTSGPSFRPSFDKRHLTAVRSSASARFVDRFCTILWKRRDAAGERLPRTTATLGTNIPGMPSCSNASSKTPSSLIMGALPLDCRFGTQESTRCLILLHTFKPQWDGTPFACSERSMVPPGRLATPPSPGRTELDLAGMAQEGAERSRPRGIRRDTKSAATDFGPAPRRRSRKVSP